MNHLYNLIILTHSIRLKLRKEITENLIHGRQREVTAWTEVIGSKTTCREEVYQWRNYTTRRPIMNKEPKACK